MTSDQRQRELAVRRHLAAARILERQPPDEVLPVEAVDPHDYLIRRAHVRRLPTCENGRERNDDEDPR